MARNKSAPSSPAQRSSKRKTRRSSAKFCSKSKKKMPNYHHLSKVTSDLNFDESLLLKGSKPFVNKNVYHLEYCSFLKNQKVVSENKKSCLPGFYKIERNIQGPTTRQSSQGVTSRNVCTEPTPSTVSVKDKQSSAKRNNVVNVNDKTVVNASKSEKPSSSSSSFSTPESKPSSSASLSSPQSKRRRLSAAGGSPASKAKRKNPQGSENVHQILHTIPQNKANTHMVPVVVLNQSFDGQRRMRTRSDASSFSNGLTVKQCSSVSAPHGLLRRVQLGQVNCKSEKTGQHAKVGRSEHPPVLSPLRVEEENNEPLETLQFHKSIPGSPVMPILSRVDVEDAANEQLSDCVRASKKKKKKATQLYNCLRVINRVVNDCLPDGDDSKRTGVTTGDRPGVENSGLDSSIRRMCSFRRKGRWFQKRWKRRTRNRFSCPDIDVIDGIEFLSFASENELKHFQKNNPEKMCQNIEFRINGVMAGKPIFPTKTRDITKIKGWRNKVFEPEAIVLSKISSQDLVDMSLLQRSLLFRNFTKQELCDRGLWNVLSSQFGGKTSQSTEEQQSEPSTSAAVVESVVSDSELQSEEFVCDSTTTSRLVDSVDWNTSSSNKELLPLPSLSSLSDCNGKTVDGQKDEYRSNDFSVEKAVHCSESPVLNCNKKVTDVEQNVSGTGSGIVLKKELGHRLKKKFKNSDVESTVIMGEDVHRSKDEVSLTNGVNFEAELVSDAAESISENSRSFAKSKCASEQMMQFEPHESLFEAASPSNSLDADEITADVNVVENLTNKAAFVSDFLDNFLKNEAELNVNLTKATEKTYANPEDIDTKVVWPSQDPLSSLVRSEQTAPTLVKRPAFMQHVSARLSSEKCLRGRGRPRMKPATLRTSGTVQQPKQCRKETGPTSGRLVEKKPVAVTLESVNISCTDAVFAVRTVVSQWCLPQRSKSTIVLPTADEISKAFNRPCSKQPTVVSCTLSAVNITLSMARVASSALSSSFDVTSHTSDVNLSLLSFPSTESPPASVDNVQEPVSQPKPPQLEQQTPSVLDSSTELRVEQCPVADNLQTNYSSCAVVPCEKEFCQLGCVCDSLKVRKRKRKHCGKVQCMFECVCRLQLNDNTSSNNAASGMNAVDGSSPSKHRRQIRIPAKLKDSVYYYGGKDDEGFLTGMRKYIHRNRIFDNAAVVDCVRHQLKSVNRKRGRPKLTCSAPPSCLSPKFKAEPEGLKGDGRQRSTLFNDNSSRCEFQAERPDGSIASNQKQPLLILMDPLKNPQESSASVGVNKPTCHLLLDSDGRLLPCILYPVDLPKDVQTRPISSSPTTKASPSGSAESKSVTSSAASRRRFTDFKFTPPIVKPASSRNIPAILRRSGSQTARKSLTPTTDSFSSVAKIIGSTRESTTDLQAVKEVMEWLLRRVLHNEAAAVNLPSRRARMSCTRSAKLKQQKESETSEAKNVVDEQLSSKCIGDDTSTLPSSPSLYLKMPELHSSEAKSPEETTKKTGLGDYDVLDDSQATLRQAFTHLAMVASPIVKDMWNERSDSVPITAFVFKMAAAAISRLRRQEKQSVLVKHGLIRQRMALFRKYTEYLKGVDQNQQKETIQKLARSIENCCIERSQRKQVLNKQTKDKVSSGLFSKAKPNRVENHDGKSVKKICAVKSNDSQISDGVSGCSSSTSFQNVDKVEEDFCKGIASDVEKSDVVGIVGSQPMQRGAFSKHLENMQTGSNALTTIRLNRSKGGTEWIRLQSRQQQTERTIKSLLDTFINQSTASVETHGCTNLLNQGNLPSEVKVNLDDADQHKDLVILGDKVLSQISVSDIANVVPERSPVKDIRCTGNQVLPDSSATLLNGINKTEQVLIEPACISDCVDASSSLLQYSQNYLHPVACVKATLGSTSSGSHSFLFPTMVKNQCRSSSVSVQPVVSCGASVDAKTGVVPVIQSWPAGSVPALYPVSANSIPTTSATILLEVITTEQGQASSTTINTVPSTSAVRFAAPLPSSDSSTKLSKSVKNILPLLRVPVTPASLAVDGRTLMLLAAESINHAPVPMTNKKVSVVQLLNKQEDGNLASMPGTVSVEPEISSGTEANIDGKYSGRVCLNNHEPVDQTSVLRKCDEQQQSVGFIKISSISSITEDEFLCNKATMTENGVS